NLEAYDAAARGEGADLATGGRAHRRDDDVVVGARAVAAGWLVGRRAREQPRRREVGEARVVGHLERGRGRGHGRSGRLEQDGTSRRAEGGGDLAELVGDDPAQQLVVGQDRLERLDRALQLVLLLLELDPGE